ncbi:hypothetical protein CDEST_10236 [Colletotrichum destructivum]|uniref:Zn(2)-C6 fungal-type domain-containing protein n=1 Tax=Colletotrichum destructivum TaxID=34406 RepID=A0AAX4IQ37_9PEZI|nr:hypothetical protein CDEST_10236 [Colletotrichum destructivum]
MSTSRDEEPARFSCTQCRSMKLKCDRIKPRCSRCVRVRADCEYPKSRRANVGKRQQVRDLEVKLEQLERIAKSSTDKPPRNGEPADQDTAIQNMGPVYGSPQVLPVLEGPASDPNIPPVEAPSADLSSTGTYEQRPPLEMIESLTNQYFDKWHYTAPMIHRTRYIMSLSLPSHMRPPMCLQYIVMAWGAEIGNTHRSLAIPFYNRARAYAQADEVNASLRVAHAQTWCLMCYFEAQYLLFSRSSMSLCRAIRIAQLLGLHQVDGGGLGHPSGLPPPQSWPEAEERRRTWWALYCSDRLVGGTAGWPVLINERDMSVRLPASEEAFQSDVEEKTSLFTSVLQQDGKVFSPFAGRVRAASLFHQSYQHSTKAPLHNNSSSDPEINTHWRQYREIDNNLVLFLQGLPDGLRLPRQARCRNAVFVNIIIHMSFICLHRAAISRMKLTGLPKSMIRRSTARLVCAAEEILNIFRMMSDMNEHLKNSILIFSVYLTSRVFLEDLETTEDVPRQDNLDFVLRIMMLSAKTLDNPVSDSMAVQLATEMRQRGLDSSAVEKALELSQSRHLTPAFTKGSAPSSGPVFRLPSNSET